MTGPKRPARSALALTDLPKRCRLLRPAFDRGEALPVSDKDLFSRPAAFLFIEVNPFGSRDCNQSLQRDRLRAVSRNFGHSRPPPARVLTARRMNVAERAGNPFPHAVGIPQEEERSLRNASSALSCSIMRASVALGRLR